ncbi:uncharacterized protein LOC124942514 [Impatiens glandulifera]|uniref:uncharacterized protein LOC124942514 n=1 Tax=Impatiens glandulifera TaxID=253017 RepID=UPI001FB0A817|nr:uncharacterized protein LOC124942514 [Impatiens glandulifera]
MATLKKVSADVILNTVKEAAARVLVAERKVSHLQYNLKVTKDDSLRMMLLLKQTINSKITEAENMALSHQERIEELEGKLNTAEDTIEDLRAELKEINEKMDKMNNSYRNDCTKLVHAYQRVKGKSSHTLKPQILRSFHRRMRRRRIFSKCRSLLKPCQTSEDGLRTDQISSVVETKTLSPLDMFSEPILTGSSGDDSCLVDVVVMEEQAIEDTALVDVDISLEDVEKSNQNGVCNPLDVNSQSKVVQVMENKQRDSFKLPKQLTFNRKRRRDYTLGRSFAETSKKIRTTGKENDPESTISELNQKSSRVNRRLVQIAHQLLSLSRESR